MAHSPRHWFAVIHVLVIALILAGCNSTPSEPPSLVPTSAPVAQPASTASVAAPTLPAPTDAPTLPAPTDAPSAATAAPALPATPAPPAAADFLPPTATPALSNQLINPDTLANLQPLRTIGYGRAQAAAISPGKNLLAVGTTAGLAWFELPSLRALRFDQISGGVDSLAFQFGDQLFAAGPGGQQRMRVATGEILPSEPEDLGWLGGDNPVFSPDGALVATSLGDRQSALWSVAEQKLLRNLDGTAPIFSPEGQLIATIIDGRSMLWRADDGQELLSLDGMAPTFSPDGLALLTSGESELLVWRLPDGALLGQFDAGEPGWQAEFSADSRELRVLTHAGAASSLKVVDAATVQLLRDIVLVEEQEVFGLPMNSTLGPYGTLAATTGYNGRVVRAGDGKTLFTSAENDYTVYQLAAFSHDGELAALLNADGRVYLVGAGEQPVQTLDLEDISSVAISPDGSLLATGSDNPRIWQLIDGALTQTLKLNINGSWWEGGSRIGALAFSPDGSALVVESDGGEAATSFRTVAGWPIASGGVGASSWQLEEMYGPATEQSAVLWRFSAAARALAWIDDAGGVTLRVSDGMTVTLREASDARTMSFSPDGSLLATGDKSGQVVLVKTADGAPSATLQAGGPVGDLMFSPDSTLLGARQDDGTLTVWRVGEQTPLATLETDPFTMRDSNLFSGQDEPSERFIFSADNQLLITSGAGGVIFFRLGDGQRLHELPVAARDMAIGPGGRLLAVAQTDGRVTLWGVP